MKGMGKQVEGFWKMLDDMAENDPEQYAKFLSKQADAAKEEAMTSGGKETSFQTMVEGDVPVVIIDLPFDSHGPLSSSQGPRVALIQIWAAKKGVLTKSTSTSSKEIESLGKSFTLPIPFIKLREPLVQSPPPPPARPPLGPSTPSPTIHGFFIATTREILDLTFGSQGGAAQDASLTRRRSVLAASACQFIESKHEDLKLRVNAWRIRVSPLLLGEAERQVLQQAQHQAKASRAAQGTAAQGLSSSLLGQLTNLGVDQKEGLGSKQPEATQSKMKTKGPLISELTSEPPDPSKDADETEAVVFIEEGGRIVVKIKLPSANKASDVDVHVEEGGSALLISVETADGERDKERRVALPHPIDDSQMNAKWDKKIKTLTITLLVKP